MEYPRFCPFKTSNEPCNKHCIAYISNGNGEPGCKRMHAVEAIISLGR